MQYTANLFSIAALLLYSVSFAVSLWKFVKGDSRPFLSRLLLLIAIAIHFVALILRSYYVGHAPMANLYETLLFFSFSVSLATLVYNFRYKVGIMELISIPVASGLLAFAISVDHKFTPLFLALKTIWFEVHVMASFAGYALFTVSFAAAFFFLCHMKRDPVKSKVYEEIVNSSNVWGFSFFSLAMFSGAIWAYLAWGNYWFWEPKTLWSFILWFYFAGIVHGHYLKSWRGKKVAWMTIFGFLVVIFTYVGVGLLMKSSHKL
ncbi:MAG: cytochrome c biogenesis protein CcsA [bacterium]|nr:cytochrome c biogenesis protein CcsA [bacterium]